MDNNTTAIRKLKFHLTGRNKQVVPCLVGETGIGKTTIVNKVARDLGAEIVYFNMSQQNEGDNALPVPFQNDFLTNVQYALNHKFQEIIDNPDKKYIVMCDEIARGRLGVISEWMTVLTERQIQGHKLGDNVRFVAAMNPSTSMKGYENTEYVATEMDPAHLTRFNFIYMAPDRNDWLEWAASSDIHPYVIDFLSDNKNINFFYGQAQNDVRMRTPKGWEHLSDMLKDLEEQGLFNDRAFTAGIISDQIGEDAGPLFAKMMWEKMETIQLNDILGKPHNEELVRRFDSFDLTKQMLTINGWMEALKEINPKTFTYQDVENISQYWNILKSDDSKVKIAHQITRDFLKIKNGEIDKDSIASKFYDENRKESKLFVDFMSRMSKLADKIA